MECWLRWSLEGGEIAVPRPLAIAIVEDALRQAPAAATRPRRELPPHVAALLDEAARRSSLKLGASVDAADRPFRGGTLHEFLTACLEAGACPDPRPVDGASLVPLPAGEFVVAARCGAWKDARIRQVFDARFGAGCWRAGYTWGPHTFDVRSGIDLYEDGYREALAASPELVAWVCGFAEVYDTAPSNIAAYCDYSVQEVEGAGQHWQDVAIRRSLVRLGRWFGGSELLEIRGQDSGGYRLNPGQLDFHAPGRIVEPRNYAWWRPDSIEDFSVSNFCVQVPRVALLAWLREAPIDADRCTALLVAQDPGLLSELPRFLAAGARATLVAARTLSLMDAAALRGALDEPALAELVPRIQRLAPRRRRLLDRLLDDDALTRRDALDELLQDDDREFMRWMLAAVQDDPARKLRARAREALQT